MKRMVRTNAKKNNRSFKEFIDQLVKMAVFANINE